MGLDINWNIEEKKMPAAKLRASGEQVGVARIASMARDAVAVRATCIDGSLAVETPRTFADTSGIRAVAALRAVSWRGNLHGDAVQVELCVLGRDS